MACVLPFHPWHSPGLRVSRFRTTRGLSTNPAHVLSCTCAPPQWHALTLVAFRKRQSRPGLSRNAPRIGPRPFSMSKQKSPFVRLTFGQTSGRRCHTAWKPRLQGLATLLAASALSPTGTFSAPHAHGLRSSEPCSDLKAGPGFPQNLPLPRFSARPHGLTSAPQRLSLPRPAGPSAPPPLSDGSGALALPSLRTSRVFLRRTLEEASSSSFPSRSFPPDLRRSQEAEPQGLPSAGSAFPLF
jgi:hypothetical protein